MLDRIGRFLGWGPVATLRAVFERYGASGGGLLAGGLAYSALFALVPLLIATTGLTGLLVNDPAVRSRVVEIIGATLPPMRDLVGTILQEASDSAGTASVIGFVTLLWGGSRFIVAFSDAISRMSGYVPSRNVVQKNLIGLGAVLALIVALVAGAILAGVSAFADALAATPFAGAALTAAAHLALDLLPLAMVVLAMLLVYRFVPEERPSWRAAWLPGVVVAVTLSVLARAFVFLAPRLIGAAAAVGTLATAFAALAWLSLTFQAVLLGAAWVAQRSSRS